MAMLRGLFVAVVLLTTLMAPSTVEANANFRRWMTVHGRSYPTAKEEQRRLQVYHANMKRIEEFNAAGKHPYVLGEGPYTDLTDEEFARLLRPRSRRPPVHVAHRRPVHVEVPSRVDWRESGALTPVKHHGLCGACWAFAAIAGLEAAYKIRYGELISLSEQQLVDCDVLDLGCTGGDSSRAYQWIYDNGGLAAEADYPYTSSTLSGLTGTCNIQKLLQHAVQIAGYVKIDIDNEQALMAAVARQPVVAAINAQVPEFRDYSGGIYDGPCSVDLNHEVTLVGYGQEPGGPAYWIAKNSWGPEWGDNGYVYIKKDVLAQPWGMCGLARTPVYPVIK